MLPALSIHAVASIRGSRFANREGAWVRRNVRSIIGSTHPLEKSAPDFEGTSIYRLTS
jgi:hypothetical protein